MNKSQFSNFMPGEKFNNWIIIENLGRNKWYKWYYKCQCTCGKIGLIEGQALKYEKSKSCGCTRKVSLDTKKKNQKKYKKTYFQQNKQKIYERIKSKPKDTDKIKWYNIKSSYKLSYEEYSAWILISKGKCMICNQNFNSEKKMERQCVDHCHKTGIVRGLICHKCNFGLGFFKDNIEILKNAILYLGDKNE